MVEEELVMPSLVQTWALPVALLAIVNLSVTWFNVVSNQVPEPYLVSNCIHYAYSVLILKRMNSSTYLKRSSSASKITLGTRKLLHLQACMTKGHIPR